MRKSQITATFSAPMAKVWQMVTDNENAANWRSDIASITVKDNGRIFVETTPGGMETTFTITLQEPMERYEFDMANCNFTGHWSGVFCQTPSGGTRIVFTEEIHVKSKMMEMASYLFMNLKKMQETYIHDLRIALGEV